MNVSIFHESGDCLGVFENMNPDFCSSIIVDDYIKIKCEEYTVSKIVYDFDCGLLKIYVE